MAAEFRSVSLPPDLHTMAKTISAHDGKSMSAIVAAAARKAIEKRYEQVIREQSAALAGGK
jgi:metal-responsive CopG/Arc/MetJ family transcriptional regulator